MLNITLAHGWVADGQAENVRVRACWRALRQRSNALAAVQASVLMQCSYNQLVELAIAKDAAVAELARAAPPAVAGGSPYSSEAVVLATALPPEDDHAPEAICLGVVVEDGGEVGPAQAHEQTAGSALAYSPAHTPASPAAPAPASSASSGLLAASVAMRTPTAASATPVAESTADSAAAALTPAVADSVPDSIPTEAAAVAVDAATTAEATTVGDVSTAPDAVPAFHASTAADVTAASATTATAPTVLVSIAETGSMASPAPTSSLPNTTRSTPAPRVHALPGPIAHAREGSAPCLAAGRAAELRKAVRDGPCLARMPQRAQFTPARQGRLLRGSWLRRPASSRMPGWPCWSSASKSGSCACFSATTTLARCSK